MSNKNTQRNKRYLSNKGLVTIKLTDEIEVKNLFFEATRNQGTNPSQELRKFIRKYNSSYINKYEGQKTFTTR